MHVARALVALMLTPAMGAADDESSELTVESEAPGTVAPAQPAYVTRWATRSLGYAQRELSLSALLLDGGADYPYGNPLIANFANQYKGGFVQFDATAGVGTDTDAGAIANGAFDASWELPLCRVLGVSGSGQLGWKEENALVAWTTTAAACLPLPANTIWGSYTHGENVRLSMFDGVATLRERQTTDTINAHIRFLRWRDPEHFIEVAPIDVIVYHTTDGSRLGAWTLHFDLSFGTWSREGTGLRGTARKLSFFNGRVTEMYDDVSPHSAFGFTMSPLRIDNWRIGQNLAFNAALGIALGGGRDSSRTMGYDMTGAAIPHALASWEGLYAEGGLTGAFGAWSPSLTYARTISPSFDGQLVRDDRVAGSLAYESGRWSASADGFVARQRVLRETGGGKLVTGGGALDLAWAPMGPFVVVGRTEAGRTLTAGLASDPIDAEWDMRATLGLQAHLAGRWPNLR